MSKKILSLVFLFISPFTLLNIYPFLEGTKIADLPSYAANCGCPCSDFPGPTGPQGPIGFRGITGQQGEIGPKGNIGPLGSTGPTGPQGIVGPEGDPGLNGQPAPFGPAGHTGTTGPQGVSGSQGFVGPPGATGVTGPTGLFGPTGPTGPIGTPGIILGWAFASQTPPFRGVIVPPGGVINLNVFDGNSTTGFAPSAGGIQVPSNGIYLIYYTVTTPPSQNIALFGSVQNAFIDASGFCNISGNIISGQVIVPLSAGETVFILNANIQQNLTTNVTGVTALNGPINSAEMTIWLLEITP